MVFSPEIKENPFNTFDLSLTPRTPYSACEVSFKKEKEEEKILSKIEVK